jgi:hypothetical protein
MHPLHQNCFDNWVRQQLATNLAPICPSCNLKITHVNGIAIETYREKFGNDSIAQEERAALSSINLAIRQGDLGEIRRVLATNRIRDPEDLIATAAKEKQLGALQALEEYVGQMSGDTRARAMAIAASLQAEDIVDYLLSAGRCSYVVAIANGSSVGAFSIVQKLLAHGEIGFESRLEAIRAALEGAIQNPKHEYLEIVKLMVRYPNGYSIWNAVPEQFTAADKYWFLSLHVDTAYRLDNDEYLIQLLVNEDIPEQERTSFAMKKALSMGKPFVAARLLKNEAYSFARAAYELRDFLE